ncbi:uncharacterized protein LOC111634638 [Centruroides sculpturatus]|uniref:uncharacterized protein LOC111634638 n=1 Tax=Centruroides sculpturatus TaxID=218467 RepID=UPI000C6DB0D1|nr:uncharacterized protein LOC111634638 [Centruroides sculpturatus]
MEHLQSFHRKVKDQLSSQEDALIVMLHHYLLSIALHCVGVGEEWVEPIKKIQKDKMPQNWNSTKESYKLRYVDDNANRFLLKVSIYDRKSEEKLLFVYLHYLQKKRACGTIVSIKQCAIDTVNSWKQSETAYKINVTMYQDILKRMKEFLLNPEKMEKSEFSSKTKTKRQESKSKTQEKQLPESSSKSAKENVTGTSSNAVKKETPESPSKPREQDVSKKKKKVTSK